MPRNSFVDSLPPEVRAGLRERLLNSNFSGYEDHAAWLTEIGFPSSRSAVHRYGRALETETLQHVDLRMRCLEVAAQIDPSGSVISTAVSLLDWVRSGRIEGLELPPK